MGALFSVVFGDHFESVDPEEMNRILYRLIPSPAPTPMKNAMEMTKG